MYADQILDLAAEMTKVNFEKDTEKKAELNKKLYSQTLPNTLQLFENKLKQANSGYLVESGLAWVDLYLFNTIDRLADKRQEVLANFPMLTKHYETIKNSPRISEWLTKRPATEM